MFRGPKRIARVHPSAGTFLRSYTLYSYRTIGVCDPVPEGSCLAT